MLALWNLLLQSWGQKFAEQYGATPNDAWTAMLANVEPEAARYAFTKLIDSGSAFPPTLPEFVAWAKKYRPVEIRYDANGRAFLAGDRVPVEYQQRCPPEVAQENLAKLRAMLEGVL